MLCFRWIQSVGRQLTTQIPTYCILFQLYHSWLHLSLISTVKAAGQFVLSFNCWLSGCVWLVQLTLLAVSVYFLLPSSATRTQVGSCLTLPLSLTLTVSWMLCLCPFSDQPGILCSFKIPSAWSCAWCLNPQFDKTFSTGQSVFII